MGQRAFALGIVLWVGVAAAIASANEIELTLREGTNFAVALSPLDGSLVFDLQGTLWRLSAQGGEATALTDGLGDDRMPDFSSDGRRIVFQSYRRGTWDIWAMDPDGANATPLTDDRFDDREPALSPDGERVAFSSDRSGNYDVWILEIETGDLSRVTTHEASDAMPAWSPAGDALAFVSDRDGNGFTGLYRIGVGDGAEPQRLATFPGRVSSPSWSPGGERLAVSVLELGVAGADAMGRAATASRLVLVPAAGGEPRTLATPEDVFPFRAQWAGDDEIVYTAEGSIWRQGLGEQDEARAISFEAPVTLNRPSYRRRPVAFAEERKLENVRGIVRPSVAPDGSMIVFAALGDLWVVSTDGGDPVPLTRDEHLDTDPSWSPDSRSVVFASDRGGTMDLWIKEIEAPPRSGERRLTTSLGAELAPAFSPDGAEIAYLDENARLHVVAVEGGEDRTLTEPRRGASMPSWSPDGRYVAISVHVPISSRFREGHNRILIADTETGDTRLLDAPDRSFGTRDGDGPIWSPDGRKLAFAMDGGLWLLPVTPDGTPEGRPRQILGEAVDFPSWTRDSQKILCVTPGGLRQVSVGSGAVSEIDVRHTFEVSAARGRLLLRDVRLVDGTGAPPREHVDVVIDGNRIESIEPTGVFEEEEIRVVDGAGKTLIPGLIEMHTHLSLPSWGNDHGRVWLAYGVTSIRTPADAPYRVLEERESIQAGRRVGPRIFFTGGTMDGDRIYYSGALAIEDEEELEQEMARAFDLGYDLIKTYVRLPDDLQKTVIEKAHREGIFVTSHEVYPAVAYGVDGIEHVRGTSRRGYSPKITNLRRTYADVIELIARSEAYFTPTVLIHGGFSLALAREPALLEERRFRALFPPWARQRIRSGAASGDPEASKAVIQPVFETVAAIFERGGKILAGTDSPIVPYGFSLLLEIEQLAESGLGHMGALEAATRLAAEALGAGEDLGTVEVGKIADLVLLQADPIEDIRNLRTTEAVIVGGRLLNVEQLLK